MLAAQGLLWGYFAILGVLMSIVSILGLFTGVHTPLPYYFLYAQLYFGIFIWIGWCIRAYDRKYLVKRKAFWALSLIHHLLWLIPFLVKSSPYEDPFASKLFACYFVVVAFISAIFIFLDKDKVNPIEVVDESHRAYT